jgi:hypothetical protein
MKRKVRRRTSKRPRSKPSSTSIQGDIREITRAISTVKKVANLPGMKSVLTALYGEKRYAQHMLAKNYPRLTAPTKSAGRKGPKVPAAPRLQQERTTKGEKIARGWRFAEAIKENYGNDPVVAKMSKAQIRGEYRKFRRGLKSRVSDIMWYNPSP